MKLIIFIILSTVLMQSKPQIIYVYDPFCSWCYAMSDVVERIENEYKDDFDFVPMTGGMILNEDVGSINEKFSFLKNAFKKVEDYTGTQFGPVFKKEVLEKGDFVINSFQPSLGIRVFKSLDSNNVISYIHKVQEAFYFDGKDIKDLEVLSNIAGSLGIDEVEFKNRYNDKLYHELTKIEFDNVKEWGISGYPTILYKDGDSLYLVASGYQYFMDLKNIMNQIKSKKAD